MLKIAICFHPINDLGGIINHTEELGHGLKELGHKVDLLWFYNQAKFSSSNKSTLWDSGKGAFGIPFNQKSGWKLDPIKNKISYKGKENLLKAKQRLSKYDLVIWSVPVPTKQKQNKGNSSWFSLYKANKNQIAIIHDANVVRSTPWVLAIAKYLKAFVCVHEASYNTSSVLGVPRALIFNPHNLSNVKKWKPWEKRKAGFLSVQVFKRIKHVDDLLRAIPYMKFVDKSNMFVAGGGIEYHYMTSANKCKPEYEGLWNKAVESGMNYSGFITNNCRDNILHNVRCLIDPSWDMHYSLNGGHFNRTIIEAIKCGCIPIARDLGMSNNANGKNLLFTPNENYVMIPYDAKPRHFAEIVDSTVQNKVLFKKITRNNQKLLPLFDRKHIAKEIIKAGEGKPCGFFNSLQKDELYPPLKVKAMESCVNFFGIKIKRWRKQTKKDLK